MADCRAGHLHVRLIACIVFIFSNSMKVGNVSEAASGRVLALVQKVLTHLGMPGAASHVTMHLIPQVGSISASICWKVFCLMLCLRVYTRHFFKHMAWPILGGLLTALTDETIQLFSPGRSSQVMDVWIDFAGVMTGLLAGMFVLALFRMCRLLYIHRNED